MFAKFNCWQHKKNVPYLSLKATVSKMQPADKIRPYYICHAARDLISETRNKDIWKLTNTYFIRSHTKMVFHVYIVLLTKNIYTFLHRNINNSSISHNSSYGAAWLRCFLSCRLIYYDFSNSGPLIHYFIRLFSNSFKHRSIGTCCGPG
jgi:hypothetical protein